MRKYLDLLANSFQKINRLLDYPILIENKLKYGNLGSLCL